MHHGERRPLLEDPALRGVGLVLSAPCLQSWLTESLGRPCTVVLRRLRYKAGTSAVLGFDLTTERAGVSVTEPCVARAYADHADAKISKTLRTAPPGSCLAHDPRRHALVTTAAADRALPLLPRLARPDGLAQLLGRLVPEGPDPSRARVRTVRHNPGRRWVGVLERDQEAALLLRGYHGGGSMSRAAARYSALGRDDRVSTPRLVATSRSFAVAAVTWAEGHELGSTGSPDLWRASGVALARLHDSTGLKLSSSEPALEAAAVERTCRQIATLLPELSHDVSVLVRTTGRLLEHLPRDRVALHGDFSADQVVVGPDGVPVLIDLDSACWGASASDLGCLAASTMSQAEASGMRPRGERDLAALVAGYEEVRRSPDPFAVGVHTVGFRLRKAIDPFRDCAPDWPEQVKARLTMAQAGLDELTSVGSRR